MTNDFDGALVGRGWHIYPTDEGFVLEIYGNRSKERFVSERDALVALIEYRDQFGHFEELSAEIISKLRVWIADPAPHAFLLGQIGYALASYDAEFGRLAEETRLLLETQDPEVSDILDDLRGNMRNLFDEGDDDENIT